MQTRMFVLLSLAVLGTWMVSQAGSSVLLAYRATELNIGIQDFNYSLIIAIGWFAQGLATVLFGFVTDAERRRFGSRLRLLWVGIGAFPLSIVLLEISNNWVSLYGSWFILECITGALTATCFGIAGEYISDDYIGYMSGIFGAMPGIALLAGVAVADTRLVAGTFMFYSAGLASMILLLPLALYYTANHRLMVVAEAVVKSPYRLGLGRLFILVAMITAAAAAIQTYPVQYLSSEVHVSTEQVPEQIGWLGLAAVGGVIIGSLISGAVMVRLRGGLQVIAAAALIQAIGLALMHSASDSGYYLLFYAFVSLGIGATAGTLTATAVWTLGRHGVVGRNLSMISAAQTVPYFALAIYAIYARQGMSWHETMDNMFVIATVLSVLAIVPLSWNRITESAIKQSK